MTDDELRRLIESSAAETRRYVTTELRQEIAETRTELRREIGVVAENLDNKIQVVAEVLNGRIEKLRADTNEGFANVDRRFNDMEAAMGFGHGELQKRIEDHETRIQRLEGTHRPS